MKRYLLPLLRAALRTIGAPEETEIVLGAPRDPERGDIATPVALSLARVLELPPSDIASRIVAALSVDPQLVAGVSVEEPGFINFRMTPRFFRKQLEAAMASGQRYGRSNVGEGLRVDIEYVSATPDGPLDVAQERNAVVGDMVATLLDWSGYEVTREYYFGNAGGRMLLLARSIHARYMQALGHQVELPAEGYDQDYVGEIAAEIVRSYGKSFIDPTDNTLQAIQDIGERWSFARIKRTLAALSIEHDIYFNEDSLYKNGLIADTLRDLERAGATLERAGATWLKREELSPAERMLVTPEQEPTELLAGIAYHRDKFRRGFQLMVDVVESSELASLADIKGALSSLDYDLSRIRIVPTQSVRFISEEPLPSFDILINELGADVIRFFFAMRATDGVLEFDLDLAREHSERNPLYLIQYAHARVASLLRHAQGEGFTVDHRASLDSLACSEELALIRGILEFPNVIVRATRDLEPRIVADYLQEVATTFNLFHHNCRVVSETQELRDARLRLLAITRTTLENGLKVLGITAPERV